MTAAINEAERDVLQPDAGPDDAALADSPWRVTDERSAEYALLRIRITRLDVHNRTVMAREMKAEHEARAAELARFIDHEEEKADGTISHFQALLTGWHRARLAEDPKATSIRLACGVLRSRAASDRVEVIDAEAVTEIADAEGLDFAKWEPKVNRTKLLAWIKQTGHVPAGAELVRATDDDRSFVVDVPDVELPDA